LFLAQIQMALTGIIPGNPETKRRETPLRTRSDARAGQ
jgi:hypothetical protein